MERSIWREVCGGGCTRGCVEGVAIVLPQCPLLFQ